MDVAACGAGAAVQGRRQYGSTLLSRLVLRCDIIGTSAEAHTWARVKHLPAAVSSNVLCKSPTKCSHDRKHRQEVKGADIMAERHGRRHLTPDCANVGQRHRRRYGCRLAGLLLLLLLLPPSGR